MLAVILRVVIAYLLGSVIGSLVVGKFAGVDIRTQGSGNAGSTNALRTQGKAFAAWVFVIDVGKGLLATGLVPWLPLPGLHNSGAVSLGWVAAACGVAVVAGHVYPVFFGFRGGKGFATYLGALLAFAPLALLPVLIVWILVLVLSGYVGLSTVLCVWAVPVFALIVDGAASPVFGFGIVMALFILYTHRSNVSRLMAGTENQFKRAMLLRRHR